MIEISIENVYTEAKGLSEYPDVMKCLEAFAPGYKYTLNFKRGRWDGKVNLFDGERFLTGLLPVVLDALEARKVPYTVEDERGLGITVKSPKVLTGGHVALRDYQREAVNKAMLNSYLGTWWPRGVIQVATGGGKTEMAADMICMVGAEHPSMFLVHRKDLQTQAIERFSKYKIPVGTLDTIDQNMVTVATIQSLMSWDMTFEKYYTNSKGEDVERTEEWMETKHSRQKSKSQDVKAALCKIHQVFIDEAHLVASKVESVGLFGRALQLMPNAYMRWGLTATPFMREQLHDWMLEGGTGPILVKITNRELIDAGYLTECVVDMYLTGKQPDIPKTWPECYDFGVVTNRIRNDKIVKCFNTYPGPTLVLVSSLKHGALLANKLNVPFLSGQSSADERKEAIEDMKAGRLTGVVASTIWDEGIDIANIKTVILAGGGKSDIKNLQRLGRGLRISEGKSQLQLVDFLDQSPAILARHSQLRKALWTDQGFKINIDKAI
jgi:superfamily II DNA or RNA helicase